MATILLSAAGAAAGASLGGSVLGLSTAVVGRAVGATLGRVIDAKILGAGSPAIDSGRIERFRLTGASEGAPMAKVHGRVRLAGQVIWASQFREDVAVTGGGKGAPSTPTTREYSYSVSLAIALCEGEIMRVGRIWADGTEISKADLNLRVYRGGADQLPDPKIEAVEGTGAAPAYRGTAYVVIEDLDLAPYGNRVPQFSFEVMRSGKDDVAGRVKAVAVIPGTGEYALATTPVHFEDEPGVARSANVNTASGMTDFATSVETLAEELPSCRSASLVVSWFGSDLRCADCEVRPRAEQDEAEGVGMEWRVAGETRGTAGLVPRDGDDRPIYGGTPADESVVEAIAALGENGQGVMFYPFVLMEQQEGNALPDPWTGAAGQPALPWRGRITTSLAPGLAGSPDGTAAAEAEVAAFFGGAVASDFAVADGRVEYTGSDDWTYRRFILHYAHLCAMAGGVDAFCIGSELRSLTQVRSAGNAFPAVAALRQLAAEVRAVLGAETKIGYAADWSEYFGYHPGGGDVFFHLDPLWADAEIDFVGIDNYMPLADWRDGETHADAGWGSIHNIDYLKANVAGGEGYDWYYHAPEAEAAQNRTPITDGAHGEPWIWRVKDIEGWWSNLHHDRVGGVRSSIPTGWVPGMKPVWFTEIGCAAIDRGANQPNKFLDPKSSESALPKHSGGGRDDLMQMQALTAVTEFWEDGKNNPVSPVYGGPMVDTARIYVWAWDARPYPQFPANEGVWSDGANYGRGHWLTGRAASRSLAGVISETCASAGLAGVDTSEVWGVVRGYAVEGGQSARAELQPLLLAHGVDAIERDGRLIFKSRTGRLVTRLKDEALALGEDGSVLQALRDPDAETSGRIRLNFVEADGDYEVRSEESVFPGDAARSISDTEVPLALTRGEGRVLVERWLAESRVSRERVTFSLPPSAFAGAGDVVEFERGGVVGRYRIDRVEDAGQRLVEAVRIEASIYEATQIADVGATAKPVTVPLPVRAEVFDLPLLSGREDPVAPYLAASADPWPGEVAVYSSADGASWRFEQTLARRATLGTTLNGLPAAEAGRWDRGPSLSVRLISGALGSIDEATVFRGGNSAAILTPDGTTEVIQFRDAVLTAPDTWDLSMRLRGLAGTEHSIPLVWPAGSAFVLLDGAVSQIAMSPDQRGIERRYRIGPASKPVDHGAFRDLMHTATGAGLHPFAPCHLRHVRQADGSVAIGWTRRTRIDGDGWGPDEVPLGEQDERYRIRIVAGGTLRREATVTAPFWTYTPSMQAEDAVSGSFDVEVAQISDRVGPGPFARSEIE